MHSPSSASNNSSNNNSSNHGSNDGEDSFGESWELSNEQLQLQMQIQQRTEGGDGHAEADALSSIEDLTAILAAEDSSSISLSLPKSFDEPLLDAMFRARPVAAPSVPSVGAAVRSTMIAELEPAEMVQRIATIDSERLVLQKKLESERLRYQHEVQLLKQKLEQERRRHQSTELELRTDLDSIRQRLQEKLEHAADIHVSDALYAELKQVDPRHHTLKERVQIEVFEKIAPVRKELESTRIKLQEVQRTLEATTQNHEVLVAESARARRLADVREEGLNIELTAAKQRCKELAAAVEAEAAKAKVNAEKAQQFDELQRNFDQTSRELQECKQLLHQQTDSVNQLTVSERELQAQVADLERNSQLLKLDKEYLQRELHLATGRIDQLERSQNELDRDYRETKTHKERLMEQILELQTTTKVTYDMHINKEFDRLRSESQQQLEVIKQHHQEVLDRETRVLREAKNEASRQVEELRKQLTQVENSRQELTLRLAKIESEQDGRVAELQSEVKVKTFELNQLKSTLETKLARARQHEVELDMAKEEVNIHKRQFLVLEQETGAEIRRLTLALATANEKLQAYEALETEIDQSIVRMGKENDPKSVNARSNTVQWSVHNLPSIAQRRTQQALYLAQQLHQKEAEISECNQRYRRLKLALDEANSKRELAEKALERSQHPTHYLVQQLRTVEEDNLALQQELEQVQTQLDAATQELRRHQVVAAQTEEKLRQLMKSRLELSELKSFFQQLLEEESRAEAQDHHHVLIHDEEVDDTREDDDEDGDDGHPTEAFKHSSLPSSVQRQQQQHRHQHQGEGESTNPFLDTLQAALHQEKLVDIPNLSASLDAASIADTQGEKSAQHGNDRKRSEDSSGNEHVEEQDDDDDLEDEVLSKLSVYRGSEAGGSQVRRWHISMQSR